MRHLGGMHFLISTFASKSVALLVIIAVAELKLADKVCRLCKTVNRSWLNVIVGLKSRL